MAVVSRPYKELEYSADQSKQEKFANMFYLDFPKNKNTANTIPDIFVYNTGRSAENERKELLKSLNVSTDHPDKRNKWVSQSSLQYNGGTSRWLTSLRNTGSHIKITGKNVTYTHTLSGGGDFNFTNQIPISNGVAKVKMAGAGERATQRWREVDILAFPEVNNTDFIIQVDTPTRILNYTDYWENVDWQRSLSIRNRGNNNRYIFILNSTLDVYNMGKTGRSTPNYLVGGRGGHYDVGKFSIVIINPKNWRVRATNVPGNLVPDSSNKIKIDNYYVMNNDGTFNTTQFSTTAMYNGYPFTMFKTEAEAGYKFNGFATY